MRSGATFSYCKNYRYTLSRIWDGSKGYVMFLMLNPSTADERKNDRTVERCQRYAKQWGYGGLWVCNLFAYRSKKREVLKTLNDPIGPDNDGVIIRTAKIADLIVCAWGIDGALGGRGEAVTECLTANGFKLYCLATTKNGQPRHPLYLKKSLTPIESPPPHRSPKSDR